MGHSVIKRIHTTHSSSYCQNEARSAPLGTSYREVFGSPKLRVFWQATSVVVAGTPVAHVKAAIWNVTHQTPSGWASATVAEQWLTAPDAGPLDYRYASLNDGDTF